MTLVAAPALFCFRDFAGDSRLNLARAKVPSQLWRSLVGVGSEASREEAQKP
jgi:hypothetical protein